MQLQLVDRHTLQSFCESSWLQLRDRHQDIPTFIVPKALPDSLLQRLYTLFKESAGSGIALRNFSKVWSKSYPGEVLDYRSFGFRDVRGLLSQLPFVEKYGNKHDAKYCFIPGIP